MQFRNITGRWLFLCALIFTACSTPTPTPKKEPAKKLTIKELQKKAADAMANSDFKNAKKYLESCLKLSPRSTRCHWELGWVYYAIPDWDKTFKHWNISYELTQKEKVREKFLPYLQEARKMKMLADLSPAPEAPKVRPNTKGLIEISAVGDIMMGSSYPTKMLPSHQGKKYFTSVKPLLVGSDVNFFNLEGPLCDEGKSLKCKEDEKGCYSFRSPTAYAENLKDVFNVASLANNHIMDFGDKCYKSSIAALAKNDVLYSDGFGNYASMQVKDKKIAIVAFYPHKQYEHNLLDIEGSKKIIKKLKKDFDLVIVSFHAGAEGHMAMRLPFKEEKYIGTSRGDVVKFSHAVIDAGADVVLGHGPHVVRPLELYKKKIIVYSLGNFITFGNFNLLGNMKHGPLINLWIDNHGDFKYGEIHSFVQDGELLKPDPQQTASRLIQALTMADFHKINLRFHGEQFSPK